MKRSKELKNEEMMKKHIVVTETHRNGGDKKVERKRWRGKGGVKKVKTKKWSQKGGVKKVETINKVEYIRPSYVRPSFL